MAVASAHRERARTGVSRPPWKLAAGLAAGAILAGLIAARLVVNGQEPGVLGLALVFLPVVLWKRPQLGPVVLLAGALSIEQFPYSVGRVQGAFTDQIPLFHGLNDSARFKPADVLLVGLLAILVLKAPASGIARIPRTPIARAIYVLLGAVALGVLLGISHHGDTRIAFTEIRPFVYLATTFLLASSFLTTRAAFRPLLWTLVLASGFKALQGVLIFAEVQGVRPRPEAVLGHEEAVFFGLFILLTLALWLFEIRGPLRTTATVLFPIVFVADLVNSRRTAWLILGAGFIALAAIGYACLPRRRAFLRRLLAAVGVAAAIYVPTYWNSTGTIGQPARAIRSAVSPEGRDLMSNLYRVQENANLNLNIKQGGLLGKGWGVPIDYALPIDDISSIDPLIAYIPHNGVLYIIMRLGVVGALAFWSLLAAGIISACRLARSRDAELAVIGALIVCALVAYVMEGGSDLGFASYRIAFVIGTLLGVCDAALRLEARSPTAAPCAGGMAR